MLRKGLLACTVSAIALGAGAAVAATPTTEGSPAHNVVLFVPDGLRQSSVNLTDSPTFQSIKKQGVWFRNSHSLFPTFTMPNSSAMATGHYLGDTGVFSNTLYVGFPVPNSANQSVTFIENDAILGDIDEHFGGDFVNEETILRAAHGAGYGTAAIGKVGPALMFDHTSRTGTETIVVDDATGTSAGIPLSAAMQSALTTAGLPLATPSRGANGSSGSWNTQGTLVANVDQQQYFADVATKVVLPMLKNTGQPFILVFWSRDPDGTQHNQGDSYDSATGLNDRLTPGIDGPTSKAAVKNADDDLGQIRQALQDLGLAETTDIIVSADHGFSAISKESATSDAAKTTYSDVVPGQLPAGFLAMDLAKGLGLPLWDPDNANAAVASGMHPKRGNGFIGNDPANPDVVVAANGGSDLVYIPSGNSETAQAVATILTQQDYVSGMFAESSLGAIPGALGLQRINLQGTALTPVPAIVVNFKSFGTGCASIIGCTAEVADTTLQQGQGMHGSFSRADTFNFMAAIGPDFKRQFTDDVPVSNADVGRTIAHILGLTLDGDGPLKGRVATEALPGGATPTYAAGYVQSPRAENGRKTVLRYQTVGDTKYFDAAGFPGRTVGLYWSN